MASVDRLLRIIDTQNEIVRSRMSFRAVAQKVADQAHALVPSMGAVVEIVDGDDMVYQAAAGIAAGSVGTRLSRNSSLSGLCVREANALYCCDVAVDPRVDRAACARLGIMSMIVTPLFFQGAAVGVLKVMSPRTNAFTSEDLETLGLLAGVIGACMGHASEHDQVSYDSQHDALTRLPNRRNFEHQLETEVARYFRYQTPFSLAIVDLDGFKTVNDTQGHHVGDQVLLRVATTLKKSVRESDYVARVGGDEFALILPHTLPDVGDRLLSRLRESLDRLNLGVGYSFGVMGYAGQNTRDFIEDADRKMYENKKARRADWKNA